ncbi:MAG: ATP-binding protein [Alkalispirochaetaceae bacterium]
MSLRLNFRLALLFSSISILGFLLVFGLTFYSLYVSLAREDYQELQSRLLSYWAQYQTGGAELLREEISVNNLLVGERPFFVRISNQENETLFLSVPTIWEEFPIDELEDRERSDGEGLILLDSPAHDYELEVAGITLGRRYYLQLGLANQNRMRLLALFQRNFLFISLFVLVGGFLVGTVTSARSLRPIQRVNEAARRIVRTGRIEERIPEENSRGEMRELVVYFNRMLERIERLVEAIKESVETVAHDLRTPLTRIRGTAELALREAGLPQDSSARDALATTVEETDEVLRMLNTLMDITEAESGVLRLNREAVRLRSLLEDVADLYDFVAEEKGVTLAVEGAEGVVIQGDPVRLRQVVANLVDNGIKYTPAGGTVRLLARGVGEAAEVVVCDTGVGIPREEQERVWDRLYRGAPSPENRGMGLGLSLVRAVVEAHGGSVTLESSPGAGSSFTIRLPNKSVMST